MEEAAWGIQRKPAGQGITSRAPLLGAGLEDCGVKPDDALQRFIVTSDALMLGAQHSELAYGLLELQAALRAQAAPGCSTSSEHADSRSETSGTGSGGIDGFRPCKNELKNENRWFECSSASIAAGCVKTMQVGARCNHSPYQLVPSHGCEFCM